MNLEQAIEQVKEFYKDKDIDIDNIRKFFDLFNTSSLKLENKTIVEILKLGVPLDKFDIYENIINIDNELEQKIDKLDDIGVKTNPDLKQQVKNKFSELQARILIRKLIKDTDDKIPVDILNTIYKKLNVMNQIMTDFPSEKIEK